MKEFNDILKEYNLLVSKNGIKENDSEVHTRIHLMFGKARNNLKIAKGILDISTNNEIKNLLKMEDKDTFFDWVIQASYYSMFHAVNALLATKKIKISKIDSHKSALYAFGRHFILTKELEEELFVIYGEVEEKALALFSSLAEEKQKRGFSAYERLSKMNIDPAKESLENAEEFLKIIGAILAKNKYI